MSKIERALEIFEKEFKQIKSNFKDFRTFNMTDTNSQDFCFSLNDYNTKRIEIHYSTLKINQEYSDILDEASL